MGKNSESSNAAFRLADSYRATAEKLRIKRRAYPLGDEETAILNLEKEYLKQSERLYAYGLEIMGSEAKNAISSLNNASDRIKEFAEFIDDVQWFIRVSTATLGIGIAVLAGGTPLAIIGAIKIFISAVTEKDKDIKIIAQEISKSLEDLKDKNQIRLQ